MERSKQESFTYEDALAVFLETAPTFGGGLSNHGPMASEALVSMGTEHWIEPFVEVYRQRLRPESIERTPAPEHWREWLRRDLPALVPAVADQAGHGLLRVAHAARGLERAEHEGTDTLRSRQELRAAVDYWSSGAGGLPSPSELAGDLTADEWAATLGRLSDDERSEGLLTTTLRAAASTGNFVETVGRLAPSDDPRSTLDELARLAATLFMENDGLGAFALLHGVTVSNMSRVLLDIVSEADARRLEASVAAFVAAAAIGFDSSNEPARANVEATTHADIASGTVPDSAAATLDDHSIKFADACLSLTERQGSDLFLRAATKQIDATS